MIWLNFHICLVVVIQPGLRVTSSSSREPENMTSVNQTDDWLYHQVLPNGEIVNASFWFNPDPTVIKKVVFQQQRIVGGRPVRPSEAPYQVGIFRRNFGLYCGGALYDHDTVITAAHCMANTKIEDFVFVFGKINLKIVEKTEFLMTGKSAIIHPDYDPNFYLRDIAIVKLSQRICYNKNTQPIPLPRSTGTQVTENLTISGWGYTIKRSGPEEPANNPKYYPANLLTTQINYISKVFCRALLMLSLEQALIIREPTTFCAGVRDGSKDNCQGDSGGPVACKDDNGRNYLCGIVSSGFGCGQPNTPAIYSDVAKLLTWIQDNVGEECKTNSARRSDSPVSRVTTLRTPFNILLITQLILIIN